MIRLAELANHWSMLERENFFYANAPKLSILNSFMYIYIYTLGMTTFFELFFNFHAL